MKSLVNRNFKRVFCLLVRQCFSKNCEEAINNQIKVELQASHDYLAMAFHFSRSDVAMPGAFKFFIDASHEERHHAEILMEYMNKRGGSIKVEALEAPKTVIATIKDAMIEALNMEKEVNKALLELHAVAIEENDPNMSSFIEDKFLQEQVDSMKELADIITQLERAKYDLGDYIFDKYLTAGDSNMHKK